MVEATTTGPVETHDAENMLITPAFVDGLTSRELVDEDPRVMISATQPTDNGVYYAPAETADATSGGLFVAAGQLDRLGEIVAQIAAPTQLLIESTSTEDVEHILSILEQQPNTALMRSRHRIVMNHQLDAEQIRRLVTVHASITLVPALGDA